MTLARHALLIVPFLCACSSKPGPVHEPAPPKAGSATPPVVVAVAPAELTCKTVEERPAPGLCGVFEKAPRAEGAALARPVAIWKRLEAPFHAMTGRETALVVLAPEARLDAKPVPPAAYICPGAPPTVYVPSTLLALIDNADQKKYPDDFLAFVIGHELGHRMNDLTPDGCQLAAFQRPGQGVNEEELADARSAFFITTAGYSAGRVSREDMVSRFLEAEYALGRAESKGRRESLLGALSRFDGYEALYQAALSVAMTGETEAADRLLSWADELVQSHGVPLPELRVVRAITRIDRAAKMAPWLAELRLPVGIEQLRCTPLHPGHSSLWQAPEQRVRSPDIDRGRKLLEESLALLAEAEARGATPFTIAAARTCAQLYLANAGAAAQAQARAELLSIAADPTVVRVLAENRALVSFLAFARKKPAPPLERTDELRAWTDELATAVGGNLAPPGLASVIAALRNPESPRAALASDAPGCPDPKSKPPAGFAALPAPVEPGACPAGFQLAHVLPSADASAKTGSKQGITVCRKGDAELVTVRLAATTEPPLKALERTMLTSRPPAALAELGTWACHCADLERQGVSDRGEIVYRAQCPALAIEHAVIATANGHVESIIQHSR